MIDRRALLTQAAATFIASLSASRAGALQGPVEDAFTNALRDVDPFCSQLRSDTISVEVWRDGLAHVFGSLDPDDIRQAIDFERLAARTGFAERGVATTGISISSENGQRFAFFPKFFAVGRGRAIIPHGHANMISAHYTLRGRFHLRQFDRISIEHDALLIRPSIDRVINEGELASIGDPDDNIHWFVAEEDSFTLDIILTNLDAGAPNAFDIFNIDPMDATDLGQDVWRAPRLPVPEALAKYG